MLQQPVEVLDEGPVMTGAQHSQPTEIRQYVQLASHLRQEIVSGHIMLGARLPGEEKLKRQYGVDRSVVRRAVQLLREEGLVVTRHGVGSFVTAVPRLRVALLNPGDRVMARMPDDTERERLGGLSPGIPILVITRATDGDPELYSAAVTELRLAP
ncbi:MAG TPA: GntR family transcriptional regulator [Trebonia sp.]|jgi:DNA-binding GntR family transcriptional regulator|nr:GntR family transcriptional regulator [Trebonia sp.]